MSTTSNIEWTQSSWNILGGCSKCSIGCEHCYAERMTHRLGHNPATPQYAGLTDAQGRWTGEVRLFPGKSQEPRGWKKPRRVFVQSMGDLFHEKVPVGWITHALDTIQACPQHTFLMLTKRPENMRKALYGVWDQDSGRTWQYQSENHVIPNLWLGVTVCNQEEADEKIPLLLRIPAAVRFVSIEPMLGAVRLWRWMLGRNAMCDCSRSLSKNGGIPSIEPEYEIHTACSECGQPWEKYTGIGWVICGAETGPGKRPMNLNWARDLRDQCVAAGVPFFFKKDSSGNRYLDGKLWEEYPEMDGGNAG